MPCTCCKRECGRNTRGRKYTFQTLSLERKNKISCRAVRFGAPQNRNEKKRMRTHLIIIRLAFAEPIVPLGHLEGKQNSNETDITLFFHFHFPSHSFSSQSACRADEPMLQARRRRWRQPLRRGGCTNARIVKTPSRTSPAPHRPTPKSGAVPKIARCLSASSCSQSFPRSRPTRLRLGLSAVSYRYFLGVSSKLLIVLFRRRHFLMCKNAPTERDET